MRKRMKEILRDRRASSFPMTMGIVLSLIILMCGISEYFRFQVIAAGVREAVEDAVISTVNDNYAGVYHGVREGYSGSYVPFGEGSWEEDLNEGDIYDYLDEKYQWAGDIRKMIEEMYNSQMPINRIADRINVARSTLYRELRRGGVTEPSDLYSADLAQKNTKQRKWF